METMKIPSREEFIKWVKGWVYPPGHDELIAIYDALVSQSERARDEGIDAALTTLLEAYGELSLPELRDEIRSLKSKPNIALFKQAAKAEPPLNRLEVRAIAEEVARKVVGEMRAENREQSISIVCQIASDIAAEMLLQHHQIFHEGTKPHEHDWMPHAASVRVVGSDEVATWFSCICGARKTRITTEKH